MVGLVNQKITVNGRHPFRILNIMTLPGVDYDTQFEQIKSWLDQNYNIAAIGIDDTGGRGGLADRFMKTQYRVEAFTYTRPSKSEWYTNLQTIKNSNHTSIKDGLLAEQLIQIPGSEEARREKIYRDFEEQMQSLTREYKDKYLVVKHPDLEGAKDDYPDSLMMLAWMASRVHISISELMEEVQKVTETEMDKVDWNQDMLHDKDQRNQRAQSRKAAKGDKDLLEIMSSSSDLEGIW
jgi:hypothetical protein